MFASWYLFVFSNLEQHIQSGCQFLLFQVLKGISFLPKQKRKTRKSEKEDSAHFLEFWSMCFLILSSNCFKGYDGINKYPCWCIFFSLMGQVSFCRKFDAPFQFTDCLINHLRQITVLTVVLGHLLVTEWQKRRLGLL